MLSICQAAKITAHRDILSLGLLRSLCVTLNRKTFFYCDAVFVRYNEKRTLKYEKNYLNTNIYSYLEASGCQISNLYLNVVHFFHFSTPV
jgi:hypothetical protein